MKKLIAVSALTLCAAAGGVRAGALQAAPLSPIAIKDASVVPLPPAITGDNGVQYGFVGVNSLNVSFVNTAPVAARDVMLRATYAGETKYIDDKGDFAPQVEIDRDYRTFTNEEFRGGAVRVTVAAIRFDDGTTWAVPGAPTFKQNK